MEYFSLICTYRIRYLFVHIAFRTWNRYEEINKTSLPLVRLESCDYFKNHTQRYFISHNTLKIKKKKKRYNGPKAEGHDSIPDHIKNLLSKSSWAFLCAALGTQMKTQ